MSEEFISQIPTLDLSDGTEMLGEFVAEAFEHLVGAEDAIMALEKNPDDMDSVGAIFRSFHTIKGLASFLDLEDVRVLAHTAETMLDMVRKSELVFEGNVTEFTFDSIDNLRQLLTLIGEQVANSGKLTSPYHDVSPLIKNLKNIISGHTSVKSEKRLGEILVDEGDITNDELDQALKIQKESDPNKKIGEILKETYSASGKEISKAVNIQKGSMDSSIKIRVDKLDSLIDLVGELVVSETQVIQSPKLRKINDQRLNKDLLELDRITRVLQEGAMGMRLVPVRATFNKMLRIIRDVAKKSNKDIEVKLSGEETEIDKNMVEMISDPLVHMVRNSVDHGIESKEARLAKGKVSKGSIELSAFHKGSNVVIEIRDDGAGLNIDRILEKAKEKGIVKDGEDISENRICHLIFEPGFSTADKVTDISGRGVGMDVVRRNIEQLRGKIDISTKKDQGSIFSIYLPITLAIIEGIVLIVGIERYVLPINSIIKFVQPVKKDLTIIAGKGEVYKIHDGIYPIIRLDQYFNIKSTKNDLESKTICLVESDYGRCCFLVDELLEQQQVVIKGLGEKLKAVKGISGGAILGDGRVGLILDVNGIVDLANASRE